MDKDDGHDDDARTKKNNDKNSQLSLSILDKLISLKEHTNNDRLL